MVAFCYLPQNYLQQRQRIKAMPIEIFHTVNIIDVIQSLMDDLTTVEMTPIGIDLA